jgi:glycosyltransferase involved in cell wall biosynthesis
MALNVSILYSSLSPYFLCCLRELKQLTDARILVYAWPIHADAPFPPSLFSEIGEVRCRNDFSDQCIEESIHDFRPDFVLTSGWMDKGYLRICRKLKQKGVPIIAGSDAQWNGTLRQHLASLIAPFYLQRAIDVLWVSGERQRIFADSLGYRGDACWNGFYSCDWQAFTLARTEAPLASNKPSKYFLFVGRYVPLKGLDTLAEAYSKYRSMVEDPWDLRCAGSGPLREILVGAGATDLGFVPPGELPALMAGASAFVLASHYEPWGVVIHEAASAGLPLILSDACGAGSHLLRHLYNGFSFPAGNARRLAESLVAMHQLAPETRNTYHRASAELSKQYTPKLWAQTLLDGLARLRSV